MNNNRVIFCLGSNIGDRAYHLKKAVDLLITELHLENIKQSKIFENKALLLKDSPKEWDVDFYNIALSADIDLKIFYPLRILEIVQEVETRVGRIYRGHWAPREIDIDIIAIDDLKIEIGTVLKIPHPQIMKRDFVLKTVGEIEEKLLEKIIK